MNRYKLIYCALLGGLFFVFSGDVVAADAVMLQQPYQLSETSITVVQYCQSNPDSQILMFQPHENERTAREAALSILAERNRGCLLTLAHGGSRRVSFSQNGVRVNFDPNRIFSEAGREATLKQNGDAVEAEQTVASFANYLLSRYLIKAPVVLAVHNNTDGGIDIRSYLNGRLAGKNVQVFINSQRDPDDYFFTVDAQAFAFFKSRGFNVVQQDNDTVPDDGSFSVYAAQHKIGYLNAEAQVGHLAEQREMLQVAFEYLDHLLH